MTPTTRIILNTVVTYARSVLSLGFNLFSARWVLQALGQDDFGLYGIVGSLVTLISFLNRVSSGCVVRFYAYAIGQTEGRDDDTVKKWFNTAQICKFGGLLVLVFALPLISEMDYVLRLWLTDVPPDSGMLCVFMILVFLAEHLTNGRLIAISSLPNIGDWQTWDAVALASAVPIGLFFCLLGMGIMSVGLGFLFSVLWTSGLKLYYARKLCGMSIRIWGKRVLLPLTLISGVAWGGIGCKRGNGALDSPILRCVFIDSRIDGIGGMNSVERRFILERIGVGQSGMTMR